MAMIRVFVKGRDVLSLKKSVNRLATVPISEPYLQRVRGEAALTFEHEAFPVRPKFLSEWKNKFHCVILV